MPPILAGLERSGRLAGRCPFGVKRWLLHRLRRGEEPNANSENGYELHDVIDVR